jgi:hypothetical protein
MFPPAALDLDGAVRNYDRYRAGADRWLLGTFVAPIGRHGDLDEAKLRVDGGSEPSAGLRARKNTPEKPRSSNLPSAKARLFYSASARNIADNRWRHFRFCLML